MVGCTNGHYDPNNQGEGPDDISFYVTMQCFILKMSPWHDFRDRICRFDPKREGKRVLHTVTSPLTILAPVSSTTILSTATTIIRAVFPPALVDLLSPVNSQFDNCLSTKTITTTTPTTMTPPKPMIMNRRQWQHSTNKVLPMPVLLVIFCHSSFPIFALTLLLFHIYPGLMITRDSTVGWGVRFLVPCIQLDTPFDTLWMSSKEVVTREDFARPTSVSSTRQDGRNAGASHNNKSSSGGAQGKGVQEGGLLLDEDEGELSYRASDGRLALRPPKNHWIREMSRAIALDRQIVDDQVQRTILVCLSAHNLVLLFFSLVLTDTSLLSS